MELQTSYEIWYYPKGKPEQAELYYETQSPSMAEMTWSDIDDFSYTYEMYEVKPKLIAKISR